MGRSRGATHPLTPPETNTAQPPTSAARSPIRLLLVEDDDGDALLVEELLAVSGAHVEIVRAGTLGAARREDLGRVDCVLLDLDLPDAQGLRALYELKAHQADLAVLVLTGFDDERRGVQAVAAGAQDYLVKGQVDGQTLSRAVRYAVERRRADEARQQLEVARLHAEENARLERGLLPAPLVSDPQLELTAHYRPGRSRALLGGDFYDAVQDPQGAVHAVIGDVSGHGPDAAALGVCLRIAWRTLVLGGREPDEVLPTLQVVHDYERHFTWMFTTRCMITIAPDRAGASLRLAGHPPRLLVTGDGVGALEPRPAAGRDRRRSLGGVRARAAGTLVAAALHRRVDRGTHRRRAEAPRRRRARGDPGERGRRSGPHRRARRASRRAQRRADAGRRRRLPGPAALTLSGRRLTAAQWFAIAVGALVLVGLVRTAISLLALHSLSAAPVQLADRLDPAAPRAISRPR